MTNPAANSAPSPSPSPSLQQEKKALVPWRIVFNTLLFAGNTLRIHEKNINKLPFIYVDKPTYDFLASAGPAILALYVHIEPPGSLINQNTELYQVWSLEYYKSSGEHLTHLRQRQHATTQRVLAEEEVTHQLVNAIRKEWPHLQGEGVAEAFAYKIISQRNAMFALEAFGVDISGLHPASENEKITKIKTKSPEKHWESFFQFTSKVLKECDELTGDKK